ERRPDVVTAVTVSAAAGFILWANLLLVADVAGLLGLPHWAATALATLTPLVALQLARATHAARGTRARERGARAPARPHRVARRRAHVALRERGGLRRARRGHRADARDLAVGRVARDRVAARAHVQ